MLYKIKQMFLLSIRTGKQLNVTFALEAGLMFIKWLFCEPQDTCNLGVIY